LKDSDKEAPWTGRKNNPSATSSNKVPTGLKFCQTWASNSKGWLLSSIAPAVCHTWILLKIFSVSQLYTMNGYTNVNWRGTLGKDSGLTVCRIAKCKHPTQDKFKDSKKGGVSQPRLKFWTTDYDTEIHPSGTVSGLAFILPSNQQCNSCDTEPWQCVTRLAQYSITNIKKIGSPCVVDLIPAISAQMQ
jgi:hypothetical protein